MNLQKIKLSDLTPDPANTRIHDSHNIEVIKQSLEKFGQYRAFVVQKSSMTIRVGNGMYEAMKQLGWTEGECLIKDLSDSEATALSILDNKSSDMSVFDTIRVNAAIAALPDDLAALTGFSVSEAEKLLQSAPNELQDGFADDRKSNEEESDTQFTLGAYRFTITREQYLIWQEALRQSVGFSNPAAEKEIRARLKL